MKRNEFGVNFDLGVPLTKEDFDILYVELNPGKQQRLIDWIKNQSSGPAVTLGQIGAGKSTFINKAFLYAECAFDIHIALDREIPLYERGGFWGVFLGKIIELARKQGIDLLPFRLPGDLLGIQNTDPGLDELSSSLVKKPVSIPDFEKKKQLYDLIDEKLEFIERQLKDIIELIEAKLQRKLFIVAEGVDKFNLHTPVYISLEGLLNFLADYKILYEANFVHLTGSTQKQKWHHGTKFLLTAASDEDMSLVMKKRLGIYSKAREKILPLLASLSGGNPRQGIRLLMEYDYSIEKEGTNKKEALDQTCQRVRDDLLNILSGGINPELLKVIHRDKYITPGVLKGLETREDIYNAVYLNWIILTGEEDEELRWPAAVNPLLLPALEAFKSVPESPETRMLREWAEAHEISPFGLDIDSTAVDKNTFFDIITRSDNTMSLNITGIFDRMASYFLNAERKDKVIITYDNIDVAKLANDFLTGRAGTYQPGHFEDINLDDLGEEPGRRLDIFLEKTGKERKVEGYSVFFTGKLSKQELVGLEQRRDIFIDYKMVWWIPYDDLKEYLKYWPQLRQFFNIFHLEGDVFANISPAEIEEDLEDLDYIDFAEHGKEQSKKRLQNVLNYLKKNGNEQ